MKEYNYSLCQEISRRNNETRDEKLFEYKGKSVLAVLIKPNTQSAQPYYIVPGIIIQKPEYMDKVKITHVEPIPKTERTEGLEQTVRNLFNGGQFKVNFWDA